MRRQFGSCSYDELTQCVRARIAWIREYYAFRKEQPFLKYGHIRAGLIFKIIIEKHEIRRLLKMRRELKKSPLRNWDPDRHNPCMDKTAEELTKMTNEELVDDLIMAVMDYRGDKMASDEHLPNVRNELIERLDGRKQPKGIYDELVNFIDKNPGIRHLRTADIIHHFNQRKEQKNDTQNLCRNKNNE